MLRVSPQQTWRATSEMRQGAQARHQKESPSVDLNMTSETTDPVTVRPSGNTQDLATQSVRTTDQQRPPSPRSLVNMQNLRSHPRSAESRFAGVGPEFCFSKLTG